MISRFAYVVVCREDRAPDGSPGRYSLATRRAFLDERDAQAYAETLSPSREPFIVLGRWLDIEAS